MRGLGLATTLFLCAAGPSAAQGLDGNEAATLTRLIASDCLDIVGDSIGCEQVIVLASDSEPDAADLIILTDRRGGAAVPLLIARGIVFNGAMWGMSPSVARSEGGSLLLQSEQTGIGRYPWSETLTLAWREGEFVVAGYSWSTYDRALGGFAACDVNLLTGSYTAEAQRQVAETGADIPLMNETGRGAPLRISAADWAAGSALVPPPCEAAATALFAEPN